MPWYTVTSDSAFKLAKERGYKTGGGTETKRIRLVKCTKEQWLELDESHQWLQNQYGKKEKRT